VTSGHGLPGLARQAGHPRTGSVTTRRPAGCCANRPPRQALAWAAACLGGTVISARALRGGMSSAVHLLTAQGGAGQRRRRYCAATSGRNSTPRNQL
jgi:hypothetical protein